MTSKRYVGLAVAVVGLLTVSLTACAGGTRAVQSPKHAQNDAIRFLRASEQVVDVRWPDAPKPLAERCKGGVRFAYTAVVTADNDAKANAEALAKFWTSEGLSVSPSETDLGSKGNRLYSATADRASGPRAAYQISATSLAVEVTSGCAEGSIDDYDE